MDMVPVTIDGINFAKSLLEMCAKIFSSPIKLLKLFLNRINNGLDVPALRITNRNLRSVYPRDIDRFVLHMSTWRLM